MSSRKAEPDISFREHFDALISKLREAVSLASHVAGFLRLSSLAFPFFNHLTC